MKTARVGRQGRRVAAWISFALLQGMLVGETPVHAEGDLPLEPMGPSSRNSDLVISEIMYHPGDALSSNSLEYVEIHNAGGIFEDLSGYVLDGDVGFAFPEGTLLPAGGYLVVARLPDDVEAAYEISGVLGPYLGNLPNSRGTVRVRNELGGNLLEVDYESFAPWPASADGAGHSLVLRRPSYGEGDVRAWGASDRVNGSPGTEDLVTADPLDALCINEFLAHTDDPLRDQVEVFNRGEMPLALDGLILSDDPGEDRYRVSAGTVLPGGGYLVLDQDELGFALSSAGGFVIMKTPDGTRVLDAVQYGGQENGVSTGRYPDGHPDMSRLLSRTFESANARVRVGDVIINELMAHPISGDDDDQFVEVHNRSAGSRDLSGWSFTDGITFEFPAGTVIPAGEYRVVARNRARLLSRYPDLAPSRVVGDFGGRLSHGSERVALAMPDEVVDELGVTHTIAIVIDEVTYVLGGRWGRWADGGGSSLERIDPRADSRLASNWGDSDETAKAPWTMVEATGVLDNGMNGQTPNRFELLLEGAGECLVDEVECLNQGGGNLVPNPGLDSHANGWVGQGTHQRTRHATGDGYAGAGALHVIASGRGDTGANRVRAALNGTLDTGQPGTLRAQARWLKGDPYLLLRVRGNWIEAPGLLTVPTHLGTPGAANSRWAANGPPAVADVRHEPVHPATGQTVRVMARVDDPDGVAAVTLAYRFDPDTTSNALAMYDDGSHGDTRAGDGCYTAELAGQPDGTLLAFHILARDGQGMDARFPDRTPTAEGLIRFGDETIESDLGSYHAWCTQETLDTWANRELNSNDPLPCTFTYGKSRIIYGASMLYSGSPFHTANVYNGPLGNPCDYELEFPDDDLFLGTDDFVLVVQNPRSYQFFLPDRTAQAEATSYWIGRQLGEIYCHKRWVFMHLNGRWRKWIYEDTQQPNADLLEVYYPDDPDARLHKIEDWFEFDNTGTAFSYRTATLQNYTTTDGAKDLARYRWNWRPRAGTEPHDFSALFSVVDVVNAPSPEPYTSRTESLVNLRSWLTCIAVHHIVGDWDSYGYRRGKNMFAYKPGQGPWRLMLWDIDFSLGAGSDLGGADGPTHNLFDTSNEGDPLIRRMFNHPPYRRLYWSILQDAVEGPLAPGAADPILDARFEMFSNNNVLALQPDSIKEYIAARRAYILTQLPSAIFAVDTPPATIASDLLTLTGEAPIDVRSIQVNGVVYPVTWTSVTDWSITFPLASGRQRLVVRAFDRDQALAGSAGFTITSTAPGVDPAGWVVINEVMHHPESPDGAYVELLNRHPSASFDLGNWRINGLDYPVAAGSWIAPGEFHVVAADRFAYAKSYGALTALASEYDGRLDPAGETLTLYQPGSIPGTEAVVDRVRYEAEAPWPAAANQPGNSLQLVDPAQDNSRVGNWSVGVPGEPVEASWVRTAVTGTADGSDPVYLLFYLGTAGEVYLDDVSLVAGTAPEAGANLVANSGFELPLSNSWYVFGDAVEPPRSATYSRGGQFSLHMVGAPSSDLYVYQIIGSGDGLPAGETYTVSFWYRDDASGGPLEYVVIGSDIYGTVVGPSGGLSAIATPARENAVAGTRDPYPPLWLNELQIDQLTGPTNAAGDHVSWMELYHAGDAVLSLDGYYLSLDPEVLIGEAFAPGAELTAGEFRLLFTDGRTELASSLEWHTNLILPGTTGLVMLTRNGVDGPEVMDYLRYTVVPEEHSYGDVPDGQPFYRQLMHRATPGVSNSGAVAPLDVVISEWMADNSGAWGLVDPVDGDSDDWFELFNPGAGEADLGGYYLTDDLDTPLKYLVPIGYTIPPGGYLLVWADGEPEQNHPAVPHLHADFKLGADGEAIGLFAPDRTPIDSVTFGAQLEDISEGRIPVPEGQVTRVAPTPGGQNFLTLPGARPVLSEWLRQPGPTLHLGYQALPGATYRLEAATDPLDDAPVPIRPDRMALDYEQIESLGEPAPGHDRRIYFLRRIR